MVFLLCFCAADVYALGKLKTWKTSIVSKKGTVAVEIHAWEVHRPLVERVLTILKRDAPAILDYFGYAPGSPVHITFDHLRVKANGSAQVFPRNFINLRIFPPMGMSSLLDGEDYLRVLVLHELVHVVHLDQNGGRPLATLFGSFPKIFFGMTPRWFTEGVATWAETRFTQGGRQRLSQVRYELERSLLDPHFCMDVSCLDEPGVYPHGRNAYWMGADFLSWIEDKKDGNIRCLVRENADNVLFLLNWAFKDCLGKSVTEIFGEYRSERMSDIRRRQGRIRRQSFVQNSLTGLNPNKGGWINLQRDVVVAKGKLFFVRVDLRGEHLVEWDLDKGTNHSHKMPFSITQLLHPTESSLERGELLSSTEDYQIQYRNRRIVSMTDFGGKLDYQNLLRRDLGAEYVFRVGEHRFFYLRWKNVGWELHSYRLDTKQKRLEYVFPALVQIENVRFFGRWGKDWMSFQVFDPQSLRPYQIWGINLQDSTDKKPVVLFEREYAFEYMEQCGGVHLVKSSGELHLVSLSKIDQRVIKTLKNVDWVDDIALLRWGEENTVAFLKDDPDRIYHFPKGCGEILRELERETHLQKVERTLSPGGAFKEEESPVSSSEDYSLFSQLRPGWWFFSYSSVPDTFGVMTSMVDAKKRHILDVKINRRSTGKAVNLVDLSYQYKTTREYFWNVFYREDIGLWGGKEKKEGISFYKTHRTRPFDHTPIVSVFRESNGSRELSLTHRFHFFGVHNNSSVRYASASLTIFHRGYRSSFFRPHWGEKILFQGDFFLQNGLNAIVQTAYGRMRKNQFFGAVFKGGGDDSRKDFNFYGLEDGQVFGNKMFSARLQFDYELWRVYRGWGLTPLYLRRTHLVVGGDAIKTGRIETLDGEYQPLDDALFSYHAGVKLKLRLFYNAPIDVALLRVWVDGNPYQEENPLTVTSFQVSF